MSSKDIQRADDAEFDEFLLRQGGLSALLATLPQPAPSAELDARILADAEVALAAPTPASAPAPAPAPVPAPVPAPESAVPQLAMAANDPGPAGQASSPRAGPGFFSRYRMPLGLAASVVLMMSGVVQVWHNQVLDTEPAPRERTEAVASVSQPVVVGAPAAVQAEAGPVQAVPAASGMAAEPMMAARSKDDKSAADKGAADKGEFDRMAKNDAQAEQSARQAAQESQAVAGRMQEERKREAGKKMMLEEKHAGADSMVVASPDVTANAPGNATSVQVRSAPAPALADSKAPPPEMNLSKEALSQTKAKKAAAAPPQPAAPAPMAAAAPPAPPPAVMAQAGAAGVAEAAAKPAKPANEAARARKLLQEPVLPANAWLQKIEKLLQAEKNKEAWEEWQQFRQAWPDFVVDKALQTRLDALKPSSN